MTIGLTTLLVACQNQSAEQKLPENQTTAQTEAITEESQAVAVSVENISPIAKIEISLPEEDDDSDGKDEEAESQSDLDYSQFASLEELVWHEITEYGYD